MNLCSLSPLQELSLACPWPPITWLSVTGHLSTEGWLTFPTVMEKQRWVGRQVPTREKSLQRNQLLIRFFFSSTSTQRKLLKNETHCFHGSFYRNTRLSIKTKYLKEHPNFTVRCLLYINAVHTMHSLISIPQLPTVSKPPLCFPCIIKTVSLQPSLFPLTHFTHFARGSFSKCNSDHANALFIIVSIVIYSPRDRVQTS